MKIPMPFQIISERETDFLLKLAISMIMIGGLLLILATIK